MDKTPKTRNWVNYPEVDYLNYGTNNDAMELPKVKTSQTAPSNVNLDELAPIPLQDAPPMLGRQDSEIVRMLKARVRKTIEAGVPVGKAFPIPTKSRYSVIEFLKQEYPEMKFSLITRKEEAFSTIIRKA